MRAWSAALGWIAATRWRPVKGLAPGRRRRPQRCREPRSACVVDQHPHMHRRPFEKGDIGRDAGGDDQQIAVELVAGGQRHGQRRIGTGRFRCALTPVVTTRTPCRSTQRLIMPPACGVIMRGTMRSPISTTVELHAALDQRFHDDAADEAGAELQYARARFGQRGDVARVVERPAGVHAGRRSMPGIGGRTGCEPVAISSRS